MTSMKRWQGFQQLVLARMREFYREPEALFWVYGFPLVLAVVLGFAFSGAKPDPPTVDIQASPSGDAAHQLKEKLEQAHLSVEIHNEDECQMRFRAGKTALYLIPDAENPTYR